MKCLKCAYDFGTLKPNYCPFCGKKVPPDGEVLTEYLKNIDYWRYIPFEEFQTEWENIAGKSAEEAFAWLTSPREPVTVYTIEVVYKDGEYKPKTYYKTNINDLFYSLMKRRDSILSIRTRPVILKKSFSLEKLGESWWWTEEDCQNAINKAMERAKRTILV